MIMPNQLRSARESLRLDINDVAEAVKIDRDQLKAWESGAATPTIEQLWQLADFYSRDVDYFLKEAPPFPVGLSFRFTEHRALEELSIENRRIIARFDELCRAHMELEETLNEPRKIKIARVTDKIDPEELASRERVRLGKDNRPIIDMRTILESHGVLVFELDILENIFSGLSWWHPTYGPCILVNYSDTRGRKNFTLSHEYCHLLLEHGPTACEIEFDYLRGADEELIANRFAAAFIMPASDVRVEFRKRQLVPKTMTDNELGKLARRYGASLEAMGRRLEELGLVYRGFVYDRIEKWKSQRRFWPRGRRRPKWQKQLGDHFVDQALRAHTQGHISLTTLSHYLGIDIREAYRAVHEK